MALALYRKYRPAKLAEVVGQEHVTDPLATALTAGRINHAYLFSGPRGCGKTSSARILARSLNCVQGPTPDPCGECESCIALAPEGPGSIDVVELDAASHGGVEDARELRDRAFYAPAESRYRVFIVDEAHMVTTQGFNALLKIVEEPPDHLVFVFATTEPDKVLPTIRSRTHHYPFRLIPPGTMRSLLERICGDEGVTVAPPVFPLVIRAGGGSARDTLSVLDQLLAGAGPEGVTYERAVALLGVTDAALIDDTVDALAAGDGAAVYQAVDRLVEAGHDPRRFASDLLQRLRDLMLVQAVPEAAARGLVDGAEDELTRMTDQASRLGPATLTRYGEIVHNGLIEMRGATAPRLLLELLCARMLLPAATTSDGGLLERLERIERRNAIAPDAPSDDAGQRAPFVRASQRGPAEPAVAERPSDASPPPAPARQERASTPQGSAAAGSGSSDGANPAQAGRGQASVEQGRSEAASGEQSPGQGVSDRLAAASRPADAPGPEASRPDRPAAAEVPADSAGTGRSGAAGPESSGGDGQDAGAAPASPAGPGQQAGAVSPSTSETGGDAAARSGPAGGGEGTPPASSGGDVPRAGSAAGEATEQVSAGSGATRTGSAGGEVPAPPQPPRDGAPPDSAPPESARPAPAPASLDAAAVRRVWSEILAAARQRSRSTEALLVNATVRAVDGDTLVLTIGSPPLARRLSEPRNTDVIAEALHAVLGVRWTVRCDQGDGPPPSRPQNTRQESRPRQAPTRPSTRDTAAQGPDGSRGETPAPGRPESSEQRAPETPSPSDMPRGGGAAGGGGSARPAPDDGEPLPPEPAPDDAPPDVDDEESMMAEAAADSTNGGARRDPEVAAMELLSNELGARTMDRG